MSKPTTNRLRWLLLSSGAFGRFRDGRTNSVRVCEQPKLPLLPEIAFGDDPIDITHYDFWLHHFQLGHEAWACVLDDWGRVIVEPFRLPEGGISELRPFYEEVRRFAPPTF